MALKSFTEAKASLKANIKPLGITERDMLASAESLLYIKIF
jgi:hypothetical protein